MAGKIFTYGRGLVICQFNLGTLSGAIRQFSSHSRNNRREDKTTTDVSEVSKEHPWLNIHDGIFGPADERLPLPGNVGTSSELSAIVKEFDSEEIELKVLDEFNSHQLKQLLSPISENITDTFDELGFGEEQLKLQDNLLTQVREMMKPSELLECKVQSCPELIRRDFYDLFPSYNFKMGPFTVITLCQKTVNDMSIWSEDVESEREELVGYFVHVAGDICSDLKKEGYWADFIDPTCGRPYLGDYTNATLFETDERYRYLGFHIEDLGCCKVISHRQWGTRIFVGAIFTNAPADSDVLEGILSFMRQM